ncbi:polyphosphate kinase 2 [Parvularcula marina]|uniref:polyphosphate kinase 2 n=1 Tax=Parvularcula marina TaxID=2292771 RepID=UPI003516A7F8
MAKGEDVPGEEESRAVQLDLGGKFRIFDIDNPDLPKWIDKARVTSGGYPYDERLPKKAYYRALEALQIELVKVQSWQQATGARVLSLFEGRDAAGKGGSIKTTREFLNPRNARIVALPKPTDRERTEWYFQRYVKELPAGGEMVLFDRSWYNRAGVEPVMGFCTPDQHKQFLREVPGFEAALARDGIHLFKFWLAIGRETQMERFHSRRHDPRRTWKLSGMDIAALTRWDDYSKARDLMLRTTHTAVAPWTVVRMNDKRRGRLNLIRTLLKRLPYHGKNEDAIGEIDPLIAMDGGTFDAPSFQL